MVRCRSERATRAAAAAVDVAALGGCRTRAASAIPSARTLFFCRPQSHTMHRDGRAGHERAAARVHLTEERSPGRLCRGIVCEDGQEDKTVAKERAASGTPTLVWHARCARLAERRRCRIPRASTDYRCQAPHEPSCTARDAWGSIHVRQSVQQRLQPRHDVDKPRALRRRRRPAIAAAAGRGRGRRRQGGRQSFAVA